MLFMGISRKTLNLSANKVLKQVLLLIIEGDAFQFMLYAHINSRIISYNKKDSK